MKKITLLIIIFCTISLNAETTTWSVNHQISADTTISSSDTLFILEGVTVDFTGDYTLQINGTMIARGTITDSIIFKHSTTSQTHQGIIFVGAASTSIIEYSRIQDSDKGSVEGGAIRIENCSPTIRNCLITNNAARSGAGIFLYDTTSAIIESNTISNNTANFLGGGIAGDGRSSVGVHTPIIRNNIIFNNNANDSRFGGGGIAFYRRASTNLINNVIYNNSTDGSGGGVCLVNANNNVSITNSIIWNNSATGSASLDQIDNIGTGNTLTITYSNIDSVISGTGNIRQNPLFIDVSNNDFHLLPNSPCIDTGISTGAPSVDADSNATGQDGNNSVDTYEYDMGAFEFLQEVETSFSNGVATDYTVDTFEGATSIIASVTLNGTVSGSGTITVNCYTKSNPLNSPLGSKSVKRWYRISEDGGLSAGTDVDLQLYYSDEEFDLSGLSETGLTLWKYENGTWVDMGGSVTTASNYVTLTGLSAVSDLAGDWAFADINDSPLPVMLSSFDAKLVSEGIELQWVTESEINNLGYEIWKSDNEFDQYRLLSDYHTNELLKGKGNSSSQNNYEYIDNDIMMDDTYYYKLYSVDYNGFKTEFGPIKIEVSADIFPEKYIISDNYPNPFNPTTYINIEHSHSLNIELEIYNVLGERIYSESIKRMTPGTTTLQWNANNMSTGIYYYKIIGQNEIKGNKLLKSGKMILLK